MKKIIIIFLFFSGCAFFHMSPLRIENAAPSAGYQSDPGGIHISITFTSVPDRISVEESFIFRMDDKSQSGQFSWNDSTLVFTPLKAFETGHEYMIHLSTGAEDTWGNSLAEDFYLSFSTKADFDRPEVISCIPADEAEIDNLHQPVIITFSEALDPGSFMSSFMLSPQRDGYFSWTDPWTVQYNLLDPYLWNTEYTITIKKDLEDLQGNKMKADYISTFKPVIDETPPVIETVEYVYFDGSADVAAAMPAWDPENEDLEILYDFRRTGRIRITLSDDSGLDQGSLEEVCSTVPELPLEFEWTGDYTLEISTDPDEIVWDNLYRLEIAEGVCDEYSNALEEEYTYYFQTDAQASRPPELTEIYLYSPESSSGAGDQWYQLITYESGVDFSNYVTAKDGYFDYFVTVSDPSGSIHISSTFSVFAFHETFTCVTIGPVLSIEIFDENTGIDPIPARAITDNEVMIRAHCNIQDYTNLFGLVEFVVMPGLKDTAGNITTKEFSLTVQKG